MSLSEKGISDMLAEYKADHKMSFDEKNVAKLIRDYTSGYPFLVSRMCQIMDKEHYTWDKEGVLKTVNAILMKRNTLFDNMIKKLDESRYINIYNIKSNMRNHNEMNVTILFL